MATKRVNMQSENQQLPLDPARDERIRRTTRQTGKIGLGFLALLSATLFINGEWSLFVGLAVLANAAVYAVFLFAVGQSSNPRRMYFSGLILIFMMFWATLFGLALAGQTLALGLPMASFIPTLVAMVLNYRFALALAPVQFACLFFYTTAYGLPMFRSAAFEVTDVSFSLMIAMLSTATFLVLCLTAMDRNRAEKKLIRLVKKQETIAATDPLTGLLNRRAFMEEVERRWAGQCIHSLLFIDLDRFKPLNDQYGHAVGDALLQAIAQRLQRYESVAVVSRLGGDEFAMLLSAPCQKDACNTPIERLYRSLTADVQVDAATVSVGVSIGVALCTDGVTSVSQLLAAADAAMRRAKATRCGWAIFDKEHDGQALALNSIKAIFKQAVDERRIVAAVQPIINATTNETTEYELLSRWPNSGLVPDPGPSSFIRFAEQMGLLNTILWMTLREASQLKCWSHTRLALNVSPAQLTASDFLDTLLQVLDEVSLSPNQITLEVTEEVAMRNIETNISILEKAKARGMRVALDDFGSGYSSLSMLAALPIDKVKIDHRLVAQAQQDARSADILRASIELTERLGLICCVEGVETSASINQIKQYGADEIQGFGIGKPVLVSQLMHPLDIAPTQQRCASQ
ncbi:MAG: EAL domain-containing protein [Pseudomonadota bacterium]